MKKKIVVVGSLNLDLVASVPRMPVVGETITGLEFSMYPGGKGANQAVAAARLGGETVMIGRVGDDDFGRQLHATLAEEGIETHCIEKSASSSGSAVIMVTPAGLNSIVVIPGANYSLAPEDLELYRNEFSQAAIILSQLEVRLDTVVQLAGIAAELGVAFVLDPAPARELPSQLFENVTWLTPNESETKFFLRSLGSDTELTRESLHAVAEQLLNTGVRNVIIKLGSQGVFLAGRDVKPTFLPSFTVDAIDTTAAGDAFNGGFAYALATGMTPIKAAQFACAVAAISVTKEGAQPSMPNMAAVKDLMERSEVRLEKALA
jgi:ribokinase